MQHAKSTRPSSCQLRSKLWLSISGHLFVSCPLFDISKQDMFHEDLPYWRWTETTRTCAFCLIQIFKEVLQLLSGKTKNGASLLFLVGHVCQCFWLPSTCFIFSELKEVFVQKMCPLVFFLEWLHLFSVSSDNLVKFSFGYCFVMITIFLIWIFLGCSLITFLLHARFCSLTNGVGRWCGLCKILRKDLTIHQHYHALGFAGNHSFCFKSSVSNQECIWKCYIAFGVARRFSFPQFCH